MPRIITHRDERWQLDEPTTTSDGFLLATGFLLDENDDIVLDEAGFPVFHSFFLGRSTVLAVTPTHFRPSGPEEK